MKQQTNARTLSEIADAIHSLERRNIIDTGDLLIEAKAQCEYGDWLDWLFTEFEYSGDTTARYMKVADLNTRFRKLRNLRLGKTTLYKLADHGRKGDLPAIVEELAKHATETRLAPREAERVIKIGIGRGRFGDHPDATLVQLVELDQYSVEPWHKKAVAALRKRQPETDESASAIVDEIMLAALKADEAAREAELAAVLRNLEGEAKAKNEAESRWRSARSSAADNATRTAKAGCRYGMGRKTVIRQCRDGLTRAEHEAGREICRHVLADPAARG